MKQKILLISVFLMFIASSVYSQRVYKPAFYILGSDTIFGKGIMGTAQMSFTFKENNSKDVKKFGPTQVDAFKYIGGRYFVSKPLNSINGENTYYFLEYLVDGEIDLFSLNNSGRFFIQKDGADLLELNHLKKKTIKKGNKTYSVPEYQYIIDMKRYMSETPQLFLEIDKLVDLNQSNLVDISTKYHHLVCADSDCINYTKKKEKPQKLNYNIEVLSGFNRHNSYYSMQFGAILYISNKNVKNVYFRIGLVVADANAQYKKQEDEKSYLLHIPISMLFAVGKGNLQPILGVGVMSIVQPTTFLEGGLLISLKNSIDVKISGTIDGVLSLIQGRHLEIYNNNLGHSINMGVVIAL